ncbi:MAG: FAD-binding oxidoreductase [Candidatus Odinarchaeota archaeon]
MAVVSIGLALLHHGSVEDAEEMGRESTIGFLPIEGGEGLGETVLILFGTLIGVTLVFFIVLALMNYYKEVVTKYTKRKEIAMIRDYLITYQFFKITHNLMAFALIMLLLHVLLANITTLQSSGVITYYLVIWLIGVSSWLYPKFMRPILRWRRPYQVTDIIKETESSLTIYMSPVNSKKKIFNYKPGQFLFVGFRGRGILNEMHPFTIASSPLNTDHISISIKNLGDYTNRLFALKKGTIAYIEAPYGDFSYLEHDTRNSPLIFLAGGIGITPLMSMLRHVYLSGEQQEVVLIWANKTQKDIFFREEFTKMMNERKNIKIHHVLSRDDAWDGLKGRLNTNNLKQVLSTEHVQKGHFYICGPTAFTDSMIKTLTQLGIKSKRIHYERFSMLSLFENVLYPVLDQIKKLKIADRIAQLSH